MSSIILKGPGAVGPVGPAGPTGATGAGGPGVGGMMNGYMDNFSRGGTGGVIAGTEGGSTADGWLAASDGGYSFERLTNVLPPTGLHYLSLAKTVGVGKLMGVQFFNDEDSAAILSTTMTFVISFKAFNAALVGQTVRIGILRSNNGVNNIARPLVAAWNANGTDPTFGAGVTLVGAVSALGAALPWTIGAVVLGVGSPGDNVGFAVWMDSTLDVGGKLELGACCVNLGSNGQQAKIHRACNDLMCIQQIEKTYQRDTAPATVTDAGAFTMVGAQPYFFRYRNSKIFYPYGWSWLESSERRDLFLPRDWRSGDDAQRDDGRGCRGAGFDGFFSGRDSFYGSRWSRRSDSSARCCQCTLVTRKGNTVTGRDCVILEEEVTSPWGGFAGSRLGQFIVPTQTAYRDAQGMNMRLQRITGATDTDFTSLPMMSMVAGAGGWQTHGKARAGGEPSKQARLAREAAQAQQARVSAEQARLKQQRAQEKFQQQLRATAPGRAQGNVPGPPAPPQQDFIQQVQKPADKPKSQPQIGDEEGDRVPGQQRAQQSAEPRCTGGGCDLQAQSKKAALDSWRRSQGYAGLGAFGAAPMYQNLLVVGAAFAVLWFAMRKRR